MPDYIYLLENRLSADQQNALRQVAQVAREAGMNVFLAGGAVRDLTSGASVRDLDIAVQGNALKLQKPLEKRGATLWGEHSPSRTLFFRFPVGVRVEVSSTRREEYPKPGKPAYFWDNILEDLRRRDFTANAMALSLNERSYGLLMDPLNGVADIEARSLRLVSNYGFLDEPARLLRATRLTTRLGWELEERTKSRYQSAKEEGAIQFLSSYQKGYELEEIGHEEDGFRALAAMESEGWMEHLAPAWTSAQADAAGLEEMHRLLTQLQVQGINPDISAVSMQLLTAKLPPKELGALKHAFVRPGFVEEWDHLDHDSKELQKQLLGKGVQTPSAIWKLLSSANPQAVLWLRLTSKSGPILTKYENFFKVWPEARQKIPYLLMQELRITPELPAYQELLSRLFFETMDGKLETEEQLRRFLEPYSPPAPPPPVTVRRSRASRKASQPKIRLVEDATAGELPGRAREKEDSLVEESTAQPLAVQRKAKPAAKAVSSVKKPEAPKTVAAAAHLNSKANSKTTLKAGSKATPSKASPSKASPKTHSKTNAPAVSKSSAPASGKSAKAKSAKTAPAKAKPVRTQPVKAESAKAKPAKAKPAQAKPTKEAAAVAGKKPGKTPHANAASRPQATAESKSPAKSAAKSHSAKPVPATKSKKNQAAAKKIK